ncbi:MAG: hypothetical protein ABFD50_00300 [Smithella sp.]
MKIIRPVPIISAMLTASNVPETDYAAYNAGTTYTTGQRCMDTATHKIYESLESGRLELLTLDVAPAIPWLPDEILTGQTSGKTCVVVQYLTNLTYLVKSRSGAFTLGEVIGVTGTAVLLADQGASYPTFAVQANVGHDPATDCALETPLWWKEVSATNRWKAFDTKVGTQTEQATSITYQITPGQIFDSIAFLNLDAVSVEIKLTDPTEGVVYDETVDLLTTVVTGAAEIYDWYSYFFSSYFLKSDFVKLDIPLYLNAVLDITITYSGGTAKVGGIILGLQTNIGTTLKTPKIEIVDYSTFAIDDYGVYEIEERGYSKKITCDMRIPNISVDNVQNLLAFYRATLLVWVGDENYSSLIVYGKYNSFEIVLEYTNYSECALEILGRT